MDKKFWEIVLVVVLTGCSTVSSSSTTYRVAVVGDSISAGINSELSIQRPTVGWVQMFTEQAGERNLAHDFAFKSLFGADAQLLNLARPGSKFSDWLKQELFQTIVTAQPDFLIVMLGGNDLWAQIQDGVWSEAEQNRLEGLMNQFFERLGRDLPQVKGLVIGYYDLFDGQSSLLPQNLSHLRGLSEWTIRANNLLKKQSEQRGWSFLDIREKFLGHGYARHLGQQGLEPPYFRMPLSQFDIHPNTAGHQAIAEEVSQVLLRNPPRSKAP